MLNLVKELKENQEDFEFYPTTDEMLDIVIDNMSIHNSVLDIGAGTCKLYYKIKEKFNYYLDYYIIEKSKILQQKAPKQAIFVGGDFYNCSLIDKKAEVIFCNPPYSEYEEWTIRILEEAFANEIFLIIPQRWKDNKDIVKIIEERDYTYEILATRDFLNAERQARATVDIIKFKKKDKNNDPFDYWFDKTFKFNIAKEKSYFEKEEEIKEEEKRINELAKKEGVVETLVKNYNEEMEHLMNNYKLLSKVDGEVLKILNIKKCDVKQLLREKIERLKDKYWNYLINNIDVITNKLTTKNRDYICSLIRNRNTVDFEYDNIYSIILWIIDKAKEYYNQQVVDMFQSISNYENVIKFKSNQRVFSKEDWRFSRKENITHYILDYRIITTDYYWYNTVNDLITIANNLGFYSDDYLIREFNYPSYSYDAYQKTGKVYLKNGELLIDYKKYKNGNLHLKMNKNFMKAFNIEASRLLGWVKNKQDILNETDYTEEDVNAYFNSLQPMLENVNHLLLTK